MSSTKAPPAPGAQVQAYFQNPVIWEDLPDVEVICVNNTYYMSASSFAFSPGAPILQSSDLVNWEYIGHSVPDLACFGERFRLDGQHAGAYGKGVWASTFRYRKSNGLFYWYGAIQGTEQTFIFTAKDPKDTWTFLASMNKFYYDAALLIDDDDTFYLAYGTKTICVASLSADGTKEIESKVVYTSEAYYEGARMYKIGSMYYIWLTRPFAGQSVLRSATGPFGPYECREVIGEILSPVLGSGCPHQGSLVDTPDGRWYYMAFMDGYPGGRVPVLAPVTFNSEGWPVVEHEEQTTPKSWRLQYSLPHTRKGQRPLGACFRRHTYVNKSMDCCWQWNHSPDHSKWRVNDEKLVLATATLTKNLYLASNTLTHRVIGPKSMATFCVNTSGLIDGDRAGTVLFRNQSAYIGVHKDYDAIRLVYVKDLEISPISMPVGWMNGHPVSLDWSVDSGGVVTAQASEAHQHRVWLRIKADVTPAFSHGYEKETRHASFEYSYDGTSFKQLGSHYCLTNSAVGYVGYRFGIFSFATKSLGGQLLVESCDIEMLE